MVTSAAPSALFDAPPLIGTKLHAPALRADAVSRPRLVERLQQFRHRRLTLVSAPPGFGKTSLLAEWLSACETPVAWLSLDEQDNDVALFWSYVATALEPIAPGMQASLATQLAPWAPASGPILTAILNALAAVEAGFILVLDDYHSITTPEIHEAIRILLERLPATGHLVIATRADPPLPLGRLRARAGMTEIRAADLRFTPAEARAFFARTMAIPLSDQDCAALEARTEGWVAGLQLAAHSLQGHEDRSAFIDTFAGNDRYVVDYLFDEVLRRQPEPVRNFLLETSVLDRLCAGLCDASTGRPGSQRTLESLERANLFVVPLDASRQWYRYHHLFADVLRVHAREQLGERLDEVHLRASAWFEAHDSTDGAILHAVAGRDWARAATLAERAWRGVERRRQTQKWLRWVEAMPADEVQRRPVLGLGYAWALLDRGDLDAAESKLEAVRRLVNDPAANMVVADSREFEALDATIATASAYIAQARGNSGATMQGAQRALDALDDDDARGGSPAALIAMALWTNGQLLQADTALEEATEKARLRGDAQFVLNSAVVRAQVLRDLGRFEAARNILQHAKAFARSHELAIRTADIETAFADLALDVGDHNEAAVHLRLSRELAEQVTPTHWLYRWCAAQGRLLAARHEHAEAIRYFDDAEQFHVSGPVPDVRPAAALRAASWIRRGNLNAASAWARSRGLPHDTPTYATEFEYMVFASLLVATGRPGDALSLLRLLEEGAGKGQRHASLARVFALTAVASEATGSPADAEAALLRALDLAAPWGVLQVFLDNEDHLRPILQRIAKDEAAPPLVHRILARVTSAAPGPGLVEPLTSREVEILRLLASGMRNQEVAETLVISLATVKRHVANAYGKLGAGHRTEAIARALDLGLL